MKEFVEKLIGMLEEEKQRLRNLKNDCVALSDHEVIAIEEGAYNFCKNIVNELAEEHINTSTDTSTDTSSGWIACSERLPEEGVDVLVWFEYYRYGSYNRLYQTVGISYTYHGDWSGFVNGSSGWKQLRIIAWQPLPAPYKEGE